MAVSAGAGEVPGSVEAYLAVLEGLGAATVVLAGRLGSAQHRVLESMDALLLTGGGDVHPRRLGKPVDHRSRSVDEERDALEFAAVEVCLSRGRPLLGVCRGAQLLSVAFGGGLHLDLAEVEGPGEHARGFSVEEAHQVVLAPGSRIAGLIGSEPMWVNSVHHQAISSPGRGLAAVAWATDGVVEAVEHLGEGFCLGVQWHPERLGARHRSRGIFTGLVEAARAGR